MAGTSVTFTQICPPADAGIDWGGTAAFTATSTSITLLWSRTGPTGGFTEVTVYDKAP